MKSKKGKQGSSRRNFNVMIGTSFYSIWEFKVRAYTPKEAEGIALRMAKKALKIWSTIDVSKDSVT